MRILVAEDDKISLRMLETNLRKWGFDVFPCPDGGTAWAALCRDDAPQLAVLDWLMPGMDGVDICRAVRKREGERYTYIILLTACSENEKIVEGLDAGADDYIVKPYNREELKVRLKVGKRIIELQRELVRARDELKRQSRTDYLTGLYNRRAIIEELGVEMNRSCREKRPLSISIMDLDHFKGINDRYGHMAGDAVLKAVTERLVGTIRPYDRVGRFGGEEFLVILPGADDNEAPAVCERVRRTIESGPVDFQGRQIGVTASFGICAFREGLDIEELITRADNALYRAKEAGRNRVVRDGLQARVMRDE